MQKKIFRPVRIGAATAMIAITSFLSYAIGLVRDRIIAVNFGTSTATDTYNASFLIPDMIFNLFIAGALSAAFLPIFSDYLVKDREQAYKIANTMLTGGMLLIATLSGVAYIFMPQIIAFAFSQADIAMQTDIVNMTRLMLASAIIFAISNTLGNILMSYKHFVAYAISPVLYNLGIILGVIFLQEQIGIYSAAVGVLIGASLHCIIRIIDTTTTDYKYRPQLDTGHPGFRKIIRLMIPKSISLIAWQLNLYVFAIVGIQLVEGGLAAFNFARNIQSFAVSLFGIAFATAVFPYLADAASIEDKKGYTAHIQKTIQRILFFTIPAAIGIMLLAKPLVELILGGGEFDENSIHMTSVILFFFAIAIPLESLTHILARGFYALKNTITPMIINITSMIIIASCTFFLAPRYGIEWFSIGFSVGMLFYAATTFIFLKKNLSSFDHLIFFKSLAKTIAASGIMAIALILSSPLEHYMALKVADALRICIGAATFFLMAAMLKSPEIDSVKYILEKVFKKKNYEG